MKLTKLFISVLQLYCLLIRGIHSTPSCFSPGETWNSPVSGGIPSVSTSDECQLICEISSGCMAATWYDNEAAPHPNYCEMFTHPDPSTLVSCDHCFSGPSKCSNVDILNYPVCFKISLTWNDDITNSIENIESPYVCQDLCQQEKGCSGFTWFNSLEDSNPNLCQLFKNSITLPTIPCSECVSGKSSCTCSYSDFGTCNTSEEFVIDLLQHIESEPECQDLCARHEDCSWYSWYSDKGVPFQFLCVLLSSCTETIPCQGCFSGPDSCYNRDVVSFAQCMFYKELSSSTRNVKTEDEYLCDGSKCCDITTGQFASHAPPDWTGESWYRFLGAAGTQMAESSSVYNLCGTGYGGYMDGGHPSVPEGEVTRVVYFDDDIDHQVYPVNINVTNCNGFYVYYLPDVPVCDLGYCGK